MSSPTYVPDQIADDVADAVAFDASGRPVDSETGAELRVHERLGVWTVMAVFELEGVGLTVVLEDLTQSTGAIVYVADGQVSLRLSKSLEQTAEPTSGLYRGHTMEEVLGDVDVLRDEFIADDHEPTWEEVAAAFPPIRRANTENGSFRSNPHTFVGTPQSVDAYPVYYGKAYGARLNPEALTSELAASIEGEYVEQGIVGGWLPTVRTVYPVSDGITWDSVLFAGVHTRNAFQQPTFHRYLRLVHGVVDRALYFDSYLPYPFDANSDAEQFYRELFDLHRFWTESLPVPMTISVPLAWVSDFVRHAFALEAITRVGEHPRYGTVTQDYGGGEHDGFQDVFNTSVNSAVEWGMFERARAYIDNYLTEFVRDNGSIDYRGPETGQYGRMLTNLSQYAEYSGDYEIFDRYDTRIRAILKILTDRLSQARRLPKTDPSYGMIRGRQEADSSFVTEDVALNDYDQPYWNNSAEAWRGFTSLSRVWRHIGERDGNAALGREAEELEASAEELRVDIARAVERSILRDRDMPYLPTFAGGTKYHIDYPYRSTPQSFDDNRVWTEFLGSGIIERETLDTIVRYQAAHLGSTLGIMGNRKHIVVFLAHSQGYGFLQHDMTDEFLLLYYSLIAHAYTRGTWSAFECVDMNRVRGEHTAYAAAAELVVAPLTKWMLAFEDPRDNSLWLAKATPREWLEGGKTISAQNVPTRFGAIGYSITSHIDDGTIAAHVEVALFHERHPSTIKLRLRTPGNRTITGVVIDGSQWDHFDADREIVTLPEGSGAHTITVSYT